MFLKILKLPLRVVRKIVRTVSGGDATPEPVPTPRPRPAPRPAPAYEEEEEQDHGHSHGHSHDHSSEPEPEPEPEPAPAASGINVFPEDTPNPNAYKFTVSTRVSEKAFSASTDEEATTDLAKALVAIDGVASIFGVNNFVTVTKESGAAWSAVIPAVTAALKSHL